MSLSLFHLLAQPAPPHPPTPKGFSSHQGFPQEIDGVGEGMMGPASYPLPLELDWKGGLELRSSFLAPKTPAHSWLFGKSMGVDANWADADTPVDKLWSLG